VRESDDEFYECNKQHRILYFSIMLLYCLYYSGAIVCNLYTELSVVHIFYVWYILVTS
jgi:hypothetical protein